MVNKSQPATGYQQLVQKSTPPPPVKKSAEQELDDLLGSLKEREQEHASDAAAERDPIDVVRDMVTNELVPVFVDLVEKYSTAGITMQMDASNFLEGGREIKFNFAVGEFRLQLHGTVTSEAIAFHETRYSPEFHGELAAGPLVRLRQLNPKTFREFVCGRLTILMRSAARRRPHSS